jgi:hypothetical protein
MTGVSCIAVSRISDTTEITEADRRVKPAHEHVHHMPARLDLNHSPQVQAPARLC